MDGEEPLVARNSELETEGKCERERNWLERSCWSWARRKLWRRPLLPLCILFLCFFLVTPRFRTSAQQEGCWRYLRFSQRRDRMKPYRELLGLGLVIFLRIKL